MKFIEIKNIVMLCKNEIVMLQNIIMLREGLIIDVMHELLYIIAKEFSLIIIFDKLAYIYNA